MDELLATPPLSSSARGFPPRRRLEPLPEEEDTDSPTSSSAPPIIEKDTPSPEQVSHLLNLYFHVLLKGFTLIMK